MKYPFSASTFAIFYHPRDMDSNSFFQNGQALSHLKSFGPDIFSCSTHYAHPSPQCLPHMPVLPNTLVSTCSHACFRSLLDIFQSLIKYHKSFISAIYYPNTLPLSSQNLSLYLIFFNTCTCIYLFCVRFCMIKESRKQARFVFHIMTNNEARSLQMTHSLYEYIYKNYNIYSLTEER